MLQPDLFVPPLPIILGRAHETNTFYSAAAERAIGALGSRDRMIVKITKHGFFVVDEARGDIDMRWHVLTINHRTDPDALAEAMRDTAVEMGFDEGVRRGVRKRRA